MVRQQCYEPLPDDAGRPQHTRAPFPSVWLGQYFSVVHILQVYAAVAHAKPPDCRTLLSEFTCGPMRVPRTCGLKVLRTQTVIPVSAASGKTWGCSTFAPFAASACASS